MKRVLAILAALGMIGVALYLRNGGDDSDNDPSNDGNGDEFVVACPPELFNECRDAFGVKVVFETPAETFERIGPGGIEGIDAWITAASWAEAATQSEGGNRLELTPLHRRTALRIAIWRDRGVELKKQACPKTGITLRCLGDVTGEPFSSIGGTALESVHVAVPDPDSLYGLPVVAAGAVSYFGSRGFASNDFDATFNTWLAGVLTDTEDTRTAFPTMLTQGRAKYTGVIGAAVDIDGLFAETALRGEVEVLSTKTSVDLVVVGFGDAVERTAGSDKLDGMLEAAGWIEPKGPDGLPTRPGIITALRALL